MKFKMTYKDMNIHVIGGRLKLIKQMCKLFCHKCFSLTACNRLCTSSDGLELNVINNINKLSFSDTCPESSDSFETFVYSSAREAPLNL